MNGEAAPQGRPDSADPIVARPPELHIVLSLEESPRLLVDSLNEDDTARLRENLLAQPRLGEEVAGLLSQIAELRSTSAT
jgi:hypothetical protein